jgi:hypothetical protein
VSAVVKIPECVAGGNLTADTSGSLTKLFGISQSRRQFDMSIRRILTHVSFIENYARLLLDC